MVNFVLLGIVFVVGVVFQSLLPGTYRMFIDAIIGFLGGLIASITNNYILLSFSLGLLGRMIVGKYIICIILMAIYISLGFLIGSSLI